MSKFKLLIIGKNSFLGLNLHKYSKIKNHSHLVSYEQFLKFKKKKLKIIILFAIAH